MRLPEWFQTRQQRNWQRITPAQAQVIERNWQKASRHGMPAYLLTRGATLFLWSVICLIFFGWQGHTLYIMREPFYLATVIPCLLVTSLALPTMFYLLFRYNVRKLHALHLKSTPAA